MISRPRRSIVSSFFFFNDTATTEIYTLSLHDALPISLHGRYNLVLLVAIGALAAASGRYALAEVCHRKSTRLNSSHTCISYAVFCLIKKKRARSLLGLGLFALSPVTSAQLFKPAGRRV